MSNYRFTWYFVFRVQPKRPQLRPQWRIRVVEDPIRKEVQPDGRLRFWGFVPELGGRPLRVITLADGETIRNAFQDRSFKP